MSKPVQQSKAVTSRPCFGTCQRHDSLDTPPLHRRYDGRHTARKDIFCRCVPTTKRADDGIDPFQCRFNRGLIMYIAFNDTYVRMVNIVATLMDESGHVMAPFQQSSYDKVADFAVRTEDGDMFHSLILTRPTDILKPYGFFDTETARPLHVTKVRR